MTTPQEIRADLTLDCQGLACPMPIVRTKKAIETMQAGQVIEVQATDRGSLADIQSWAKSTGHQYLGTIQEGGVLKHYVRKASPDETKPEQSYPRTITNEELARKGQEGNKFVLLDVREPAEYAFHRIDGAVSISLGELESRLGELNAEDDIYVICRTGTRSDLACRLLAEHGFGRVTNVLPGMSGWKGDLAQ